jgi:hypothetical protein
MELEHTTNLLFLRQGPKLPCNEKEEDSYRESIDETPNQQSFEKVLLREKNTTVEDPKSFALDSREFEEEVANLLLEFKHHDTNFSPKRKSPPSSPLFESFSSAAVKIEDPNEEKVESKRRRISPSKFAGKDEELFALEEKAFHFRQRKTQEYSDSELLDEEDEYYEEEEEEDIPNDADEDYFDDDGGEWFESTKNFPANSINSVTSSRVSRKKAPSGSACEKHKRWKKRCPDDCPMRTQKQPRRRRTSKPNSNNSNLHDSFRTSFEDLQTSPKHDDHGHFKFGSGGMEEDFGNSKLEAIEKTDIIQNLYTFVSQAKANSSPTRNDYVSLIRWSLQQLPSDGSCDISGDEVAMVEAALLKKITSLEENETTGKPRKTRTLKGEQEKKFLLIGPAPSGTSNGSGKTQLTSLACDKHTSLHARCPPNCPERRTVEIPVSKGKRNSNYFDDVSNYELAEDAVQNDLYKDSDFVPSRRVKQQPKPKAKSSSKGRSGRKYLPQACDRHKLLHAKCPANCPDRIARDAEAKKAAETIETA